MDLDGTYNPLNQLTGLKWSGRLPVAGSVASAGAFTTRVDGVAATLYNTTSFLGSAAMKAGSNNISIVTVNASGTNETVRVAYMPSTNPQKLSPGGSNSLPCGQVKCPTSGDRF